MFVGSAERLSITIRFTHLQRNKRMTNDVGAKLGQEAVPAQWLVQPHKWSLSGLNPTRDQFTT